MDTRTALLNSAERAARARGYNGFSYADLSRDVGIRKASIHHHFPTKADLAEALLERYRERFMQALDEIRDAAPSGGAQLRAYLDAYRAGLAGGDMVCLCVAFSAGRDSLSPPILAALNRFDRESTAWLESLFERGRTDRSIAGVSAANVEAAACLAQVEGAQLLARAAGDLERFDAATASLAIRARS